MDDVKTAVLEAINAAPAPETTTQVQDTTTQVTAPATSEPTTQTQRTRDDAGRFSKGETGEPAPVTATPTPGKPTTSTEPTHTQVVEPEKSTDVTRAPSSWKPQVREMWAALPPEIQQEIHRRENDMAKGAQQQRQLSEFGSTVAKVVQPYTENFKRAGANFQQGIGYLLATDNIIRNGSVEQKTQAIRQIIASARIPIEGLISSPQQPQAQQQDSSNLSQLEQRLAYVIQQQEQGLQQTQERLQQEIASELQGFMSDPKREFFYDVKDDMALLIESGRAADLPTAYELACRMNHEVMRVMESRRATSSPVRKVGAASQYLNANTPTSAQGVQQGTDIRAIVAAQLDAQQGGGRL